MIIKIHNIAVPVKKAVIFTAEFAYFKALLKKIAGHAVVKVLFGVKSIPRGDDSFFITGQDDVILQQNTLVGDNPSAV